MTTFPVYLTDDAVRDIEELYAFIAGHDAPESADHVLDGIERALESLAKYPARGAYPQELLALGIKEYREVFFKPYRIIYRVLEKAVYVYLIADGRRHMQTLLQRRLLAG